MKKIKNILDHLGLGKVCLYIHTYIHTYIQKYSQKWKEVQLFSNCTFYIRKESEGLNLCSLFDLKNRGAFLC